MKHTIKTSSHGTEGRPDTTPAIDPSLWTRTWDDATRLARRHDLYAARLAHLRRHMAMADVPAMLLVDPNDIVYATGASNMQIFAMRAPARYLLILLAGPVILYEYRGGEHLAQGLATIDEIRIAEGLDVISSGDDVAGSCKRFATEILSVLRSYDPTIDRLAVDRFPFSAIDALRERGVFLIAADTVMTRARSIKLPIELPYMREALARVDGGVKLLEESAEPGKTESEVWAHFHFALMAKEGQYVVTRLFQSGPNTFPYFREAGRRQIQKGDLLCLDTDAIGYENYGVDYSRTFLSGDGRATGVQRLLYGRAREQLEWNASLLKPGVEFREIAEKAWNIPEEHRVSRYYCIGHGLGLAGEWPNIPHYQHATPYPLQGGLEPGMVICLESYVGWSKSSQGVKLEDQFLVLTDRVERMSGYHFDDRLG